MGPGMLLPVELNFTLRAMSERHRVSVWTIRPSQSACPQAVLLLVQSPGCALEFTPAEGVALRLGDIDNLAIRKAIGADVAISLRTFARKRSTETNCRQGVYDESERQWMSPTTVHSLV